MKEWKDVQSSLPPGTCPGTVGSPHPSADRDAGDRINHAGTPDPPDGALDRVRPASIGSRGPRFPTTSTSAPHGSAGPRDPSLGTDHGRRGRLSPVGGISVGLGHLPADRHEFTVPRRKQTRRRDVRIHVRPLEDREWVVLRGLPVTRPSRIASDLLWDSEDPEAIAQLIADAIRPVYDYPATFADSLAPHAARLGLRKDDGQAALRWFLDMTGDPERDRWIEEAHTDIAGTAVRPR